MYFQAHVTGLDVSARIGPGQNQESKTQSQSPTEEVGTQIFEPLPAASQDAKILARKIVEAEPGLGCSRHSNMDVGHPKQCLNRWTKRLSPGIHVNIKEFDLTFLMTGSPCCALWGRGRIQDDKDGSGLDSYQASLSLSHHFVFHLRQLWLLQSESKKS